MMRYIIQQKLLRVDALNERKDTPLLHTLRRSTSDDFEKAVTLLSSKWLERQNTPTWG